MIDVVIIGGGASGFVSAIVAKQNGATVSILERKDRVLKKVLTTGNGRCNYTNINTTISNYYGNDVEKIEHILNSFNPEETIKFFKKLGIEPKYRENGKVYPNSDQASSIVDALRFKADNIGVEIHVNFDVTNIKKKKDYFLIESTEKKEIKAKHVILATGGKSYPELGSNGSGYEIAKKLGHTVTSLKPVLVQLKTEKDVIKGLQGVKVDANVYAYHGDVLIGKESGELLFTEYGISGNSIFYISYVTALYDNITMSIDFIPNYTEDELLRVLIERKQNLSHLTVEHFFNGFINKKLGQMIIKLSGIEKITYPIKNISSKDLNKIVKLLKSYKIKVIETNGFKNAQVTAGGIKLNEINLETLESKKIPQLYFSGEVMDVFGDCGGYNLQWAWASGYYVGNILSNKLKKGEKNDSYK